jgi:hypothetical protein
MASMWFPDTAFAKSNVNPLTTYFFQCLETKKVWNWLSIGIDQPIDSSGWLNLITGCVGRWSKLSQEVIISTILHILWGILIERNNRCFQAVETTLASIIYKIIVEVHISYSYNRITWIGLVHLLGTVNLRSESRKK